MNPTGITRVEQLVGLLRAQGGQAHLVQAEVSTPPAPAPEARPPAPEGASRAEQVVAALRARDGEAHITEIAEALGTSSQNARNCIVAALDQGLVRRVGTRTGRVALITAGGGQDSPPSVRAEDLRGPQ